MTNRKKVIEELETCLTASCRGKSGYCPLPDEIWDNLSEVLALLKEQEPRMLTLDEVKAIGTQNFNQMRDENTRLIWTEERNANVLRITKPTYYDFFEEEDEEPIIINYIGTDFYDHFGQKTYGKDWRCWSAKPTKEQMESVKWAG